MVTRHDVSLAIAQLMPSIIRGVQLDFFVRRGITQTQFLVLMAIHAYASRAKPREGRCTMGLLARNLHVRMPTATGIVNRLVNVGFIRRFPSPEDRRQVIVEVTSKGRRFIQAFQSVIRRRWEEVLAPLSADELQALHHVLATLRAQLELAARPR